MNVQMPNRLSAVVPRIHNNSIAAGAVLLPQRRRGFDQPKLQVLGVLVADDLQERIVMLDRHHEQVHRRLWIHVLNREHLIVSKHDLRRNLAACDLTEDTVVRHHSTLSFVAWSSFDRLRMTGEKQSSVVTLASFDREVP